MDHWHGSAEAGTLMHLLWHCPPVSSFWNKVIKKIVFYCGCENVCNVSLCLTEIAFQ